MHGRTLSPDRVAGPCRRPATLAPVRRRPDQVPDVAFRVGHAASTWLVIESEPSVQPRVATLLPESAAAASPAM